MSYGLRVLSTKFATRLKQDKADGEGDAEGVGYEVFFAKQPVWFGVPVVYLFAEPDQAGNSC